MEAPLDVRLRAYLTRAEYQPQDRSAIARGMELRAEERAQLRELLASWEAEKTLLRLRGGRFALAVAAHRAYTGVIRTFAKGKKFFVPFDEGQQALKHLVEEGEEVRVPLAHGRTMGAMEGDVVCARVVRSAPPMRRRKRGARPEQAEHCPLSAQVEDVQERRRELWVGTLCMHGKQCFVRGDGKGSPERIIIRMPLPPEAIIGMLVTVIPEGYAAGSAGARGRIAETLGWPEDDGVDMAALIHRYALRDSFGEAVLQETLRLPATPTEADMAGREDWTQRCVVTIDPPTARDFDDAISVSKLPDGAGWELAVHIADVSHYVRPGSELDKEASRRGNSTYLPDRVLPMLPPRLSDGLCSLVEGELRLTALCRMRVSAEGELLGGKVTRAVIRSRKRLDYPAVLALLEEGASVGDEEVDAMLREASRMAQALRKRRFDAGALNLDMPELRALLDERGHTIGFAKEVSDTSHQLIEECMLAANETVAELMRRRKIPCIFRVHEEPAADKWRELSHTLREYGISLSPYPGRDELAKALEKISAHPDAKRLKTLVLRSMMRARYAAQPLGHFGLAKADYCHFTSPIRRYADLIVHRNLLHALAPHAHAKLCPHGQLTNLADHLSETERQSAAAEAEALRLKLLEYMEEQVNTDSPRTWEAVVTGTWAHGMALELPELQLRGYLPATHLPRTKGWGYLTHCWVSPSGERLREGSRLHVKPASVDREMQNIVFYPCIAQDE